MSPGKMRNSRASMQKNIAERVIACCKNNIVLDTSFPFNF